MTNKAVINRIIHFSNVDGPGNRTAIFFQYCPFSCLYCHNPETIHYCNECGTCVKACPYGALSIKDGNVIWNKSSCQECDTCIHVCPNMSSPRTELLGVEDLMEIIKRNRPFIRGITVSGGECMNRADFLVDLFREVHELGLTTFIDSNGYYDFSKYPDLMEVTDAVMLDVKAYDPLVHQRLTGRDNAMVLKNLHYLLEQKKLYEVRTVLLNGFDNANTVEAVSRMISDACRYKLISYRPFGVREEGLDKMGREAFPEEELNRMAELAKTYMKNVVKV